MQKPARGRVFDFAIVSESESMIVLEIKGKDAFKLFKHEAGGHRWQRTPPTEQKGRRHSSTFTVAVLGEDDSGVIFDESDVEFQATTGHGPGGQHKNKTASAIRAIHRPTGEMVFIQNERSQHANKQKALDILREKITGQLQDSAHQKKNGTRQEQIGSGERSDKIRTVQEQNDKVIDHRTGKKCSVATYLKGEIWKLM